MNKFVIDNVIKRWNISGEITQLGDDIWDISNQFILKKYYDEQQLLRNISMMQLLLKNSVPVPKVIPLENGGLYRSEGEQEEKCFFFLTEKLKGLPITHIKTLDRTWFFQFGQILARLHFAFIKCENEIQVWDNDLLSEMKGWVSQTLQQNPPLSVTQSEIEHTINCLQQGNSYLPKQLIHRDVHLGNFLFDHNDFTGYIDFDLSQRNIRIFDICYFLTGLLSSEPQNRIEKDRWIQVVGEVIAGYDSISPLNQKEKELIPCVMKCIELLFAAYFIREQNPIFVESAVDIFLFISNNEKQIKSEIH